jgi:NADH-quinone oxidoreductase subunit M
MEYILSLLVFFPAVAAVMGLLITENIRSYGILIAFVEFLLSLVLWSSFDSGNAQMQFVEFIPIVSSFGINYYIGVDGISLFLLVLTTFIMLVSFIALSVKKNLKNLIVTLLFLESIMMGVFVALDAVVFYIFWELSLIPMLYIIGAWGSDRRVYAAIKFFLYTFTGSLIMLVGILVLAYHYHQATGVWSFSILDWQLLMLPTQVQLWLFLAFFAGLAVKVPMFPFHTWLPYAHGQAPTIGSIILAAVLLKMGTYGFVRFSLPMFPDASVVFMMPIAILSVIMVIYTAMIAFAQEDMKQVIAYSSVSHMGVIVLGTFAMNAEGITGSIFLMLSHGIVSGALFMLVGALYDRRHTKMIVDFGGIASVMPRFATVFGIVLMASVGLPLTIGFVGEFLSLVGFFAISPVITLLAGFSVVGGAIYMLHLYRKVFFGDVVHEANRSLKDLTRAESWALVPIVLIVIWLGVYPKPVLEPIDNSVRYMLENMEKKAINPHTKEVILSTLDSKETK